MAIIENNTIVTNNSDIDDNTIILDDNLTIIGNMTNLADSGQDDFVANWVEMAKLSLYEMGISNTFLNSNLANYILAKAVTDLIEDGNFSNTTNALIATLRTNHPHSEDSNV